MNHPNASRSNSRKRPLEDVDAGEWMSLAAVVLACVALLIVMTVGLGAQEAQPAQPAQAPTQTEPAPQAGQPAAAAQPAQGRNYNLGDPNWRERVLQMHRARVQSLLEEQQRQDEVRILGHARGEPATAEETTEKPPEEAPEQQQADTPSFRGTAVLMIDPLNEFCHVGDRFLSHVKLRNLAGAEIDHVRVALAYDPQVLRPVRVSDSELRSHLEGEPRLESDAREGRIVYEARLDPPFKGIGMDMLTVEFESRVPATRTNLTLVTEDDSGTLLERAGRDVLGEMSDAHDGVIGGEVAVRPIGDRDIRGALLIRDARGLRALQGVEPRGGVTLSLAQSQDEVRAGDTFAIDVRLANPEGSPIDDVRFALRYDPRAVEVLDAAPDDARRRSGNWILGGVNLHDAPFHQDYPFNMHMRNEAHNDIGLAEYHMGLNEALALPGGTLARVYLRALAPVRETAISFVASDADDRPATAVQCMGIDVLGSLEEANDGTRDLDLRIDPALVTSESVTEREPSI